MSTILLVEDTPIIREPLARMLESEGYEVLAAADGLQAKALIDQHPVGLVLLDVMMPRMDGVAFLEAIRANPNHATTPVIALTAVLDSGRLRSLSKLGVCAIITKGSFTFENLMIEIRRHMSVPLQPMPPRRVAV